MDSGTSNFIINPQPTHKYFADKNFLKSSTVSSLGNSIINKENIRVPLFKKLDASDERILRLKIK